MRKFLVFGVFLFLSYFLFAQSASKLLNINNLGDSDLFQISVTNGIPKTNYNIKYGDLRKIIRSGDTNAYYLLLSVSNSLPNGYRLLADFATVRLTTNGGDIVISVLNALSNWLNFSTNVISTTASNAANAIGTTVSNGTTSFMMTASNTLRTSFVANDTTTSNGIVALYGTAAKSNAPAFIASNYGKGTNVGLFGLTTNYGDLVVTGANLFLAPSAFKMLSIINGDELDIGADPLSSGVHLNAEGIPQVDIGATETDINNEFYAKGGQFGVQYALARFDTGISTGTMTNWGRFNQAGPQTNWGDLVVYGITYSAKINNSGGANLNTVVVTNGLRFETALIAGTGGALTNYTLFSTNGHRYVDGGKTNVSICAVYGYASGHIDYWSLSITNPTGTSRTIEFSSVTNHWLFAGTYGTVAPTTITNGTQLFISGAQDGSNVLVGYTYFLCP